MISILRTKDENGNWIVSSVKGETGEQGPVGEKGKPGEMHTSVYDPQGKKQDIFAYIDAAVLAIGT